MREYKHTTVKGPCSHRKARIRGSDLRGYAYCPTCEELIPVWILFNSWLDALEEILIRFSKKDSDAS